MSEKTYSELDIKANKLLWNILNVEPTDELKRQVEEMEEQFKQEKEQKK